jgi:hypothetical protein
MAEVVMSGREIEALIQGWLFLAVLWNLFPAALTASVV